MNDMNIKRNYPKLITIWLSLIGTVFFWGIFLFFLLINLFSQNSWLTEIMKEHPAATILLPLAALASFCNVLILKITEGAINIEILNVKFSGASGPIIMWVISFFSISTAIYFLWPLKP